MNPQLKDQIEDYIQGYWPRLIRSNEHDKQTLIGLPRPYLVPSDGVMFQEMYYWDSYFMSLGIFGTKYEYLILDMAENMAYLFKRFGLIPNGSRYYFLSRSQPPFFTSMIWLAHKVLGNRGDLNAREYLETMIKLAEQEHDSVWLGEAQPHHRRVYQGLSRYFDINFVDSLAYCESGWDHSTRFDDRVLQHLPVDLNALLVVCERDIALAHAQLGNSEKSENWNRQAETRIQTMQELMWDDQLGIFLDYDYIQQKRNCTPSLASFFPLFAGAATQAQAKRMVDLWLHQFEKPGGLVTTLDSLAGRQWAAPNGWAPLQWLVTKGLDNYGFTADAVRLRQKWCKTCAYGFEKTGVLWEKYNVVDIDRLPEEGLYGAVKGFGWTNAVFVDFMSKLPVATTGSSPLKSH